jgi:5'-nucleotidase
LKTAIVSDLNRYVRLDARLPLLLDRVRLHGKGMFLMTNSGYGYTESIMNYLFSVEV